MLLYSITIFVSSFLLFAVQPLIAKAILPWFGGAASVWTVCMLFFQAALLLGYLYAHGLVRLKPGMQCAVHAALLGASLLLLPIVPSAAWKPSGPETPSLRILGLLLLTVGLPYFLLSSTSPLLQAWYARARKAPFPYRLFALSNFASLLALLAYPVGIEPFLPTRMQLLLWSAVYAAFVALCAYAALKGRQTEGLECVAEAAQDEPAPTRGMRVLWFALAAGGSTLLLAVTNHMSQNVASVPFLWVVPLALYLLTFILAFDRPGWYRPKLFKRLLPLLLASMWYASFEEKPILMAVLLPLYALGLFVGCMFCHGELARLKPRARYLTSFYLMISLGGAAGGLLVGVVAPLAFNWYLELPLGILFCALLSLPLLYGFGSPRMTAMLTGVLVVVASLSMPLAGKVKGMLVLERNFYGVLRVTESGEGAAKVRTLMHGQINHGQQFTAPDRRRQPTTYYAPNTGIGLLLKHAHVTSERIGVIGLGTGTLAAYAHPGDTYRFYEINPLVERLARTQFTFLGDSAAKVEVALGDARLSLEREAPQNFDVLAVDAFSGDAIPVHLLTKQAFEIYFRHLKPDGVLAVHVSNLFLELAPVALETARALGRKGVLIENAADPSNRVSAATWVLIGDNTQAMSAPAVKQESWAPRPDFKGHVWTDDYSNLFRSLKF